jgi:hypothetical protein
MEPTKALPDVIQSVIENDPDITVFSLYESLREKNFALEELTPAQVLSSMSIRASDVFNRSNDLATSTKKYAQIIPTGDYRYIKNICSIAQFEYVSSYARQYFSGRVEAPLCQVLTTEDSNTFQEIIKSICSNVMSVSANKNIFGDMSVVGSRCFLRRTYPLDHDQFNGNINNQHWHQDSNPLFNSKPMATIWIPLSRGSGYECPGLDISSVNIDRFIPSLGDGCKVLPELEHPGSKPSQEQNFASPKCKILDGIVFNGLTFHRTSHTDSMYKIRDVFIIRIAPSKFINHFPGNREYDFTV